MPILRPTEKCGEGHHPVEPQACFFTRLFESSPDSLAHVIELVQFLHHVIVCSVRQTATSLQSDQTTKRNTVLKQTEIMFISLKVEIH